MSGNPLQSQRLLENETVVYKKALGTHDYILETCATLLVPRVVHFECRAFDTSNKFSSMQSPNFLPNGSSTLKLKEKETNESDTEEDPIDHYENNLVSSPPSTADVASLADEGRISSPRFLGF
jgi:hypothetical protein